MKNRYKAIPRKLWLLKPEFNHQLLPAQVSIHGALPDTNKYELVTKCYTIFDTQDNTYRNYWYGRFTTDKKVAEEIVEMLNKINNHG